MAASVSLVLTRTKFPNGVMSPRISWPSRVMGSASSPILFLYWLFKTGAKAVTDDAVKAASRMLESFVMVVVES